MAVIGGTSGTGGWIMSRATEFDRFARSLGRFHPLVGGDFDKAQWRVAHGNPQVSATSIEGETFAVFLPLGPPRPDGSDTILLATLSRPAARRGIPHRRLDAT